MIRVAKSPTAPASLARGSAVTTKNCADFDADPQAYRSGAKRFAFNKSIYGSSAVKRRLKADQNGKCCYCESIFDANVAGDVEHYRPKGAIDTTVGRVLPGYYWLAYQWENLHYACPDCNAYRKRDRFPLVDELTRTHDHHAPINKEAPLLLDPAGQDDPRQHIVFKGEIPIPLTPKGKATIEVLMLNRTALNLARLAYLRHLSGLWEIVTLLVDDPRPEARKSVAKAQSELAAARSTSTQFSAAAIDHLAALDGGVSYLPD